MSISLTKMGMSFLIVIQEEFLPSLLPSCQIVGVGDDADPESLIRSKFYFSGTWPTKLLYFSLQLHAWTYVEKF